MNLTALASIEVSVEIAPSPEAPERDLLAVIPF